MPRMPSLDARAARRASRSGVADTYLLLIAANIGAWAWAFTAFGDRPTLLGTALLAYVLGLRHAVDADHIAAIDNVVRKLMQEGRASERVGLFFSLGHSTVVVFAAVMLAAAASAFQERLAGFRELGGLIGTSVSALFLLVLALINLAILRGVWQSFRRVRRGGSLDAEGLDALLAGRGLLARLFRPLFAAVSRGWHMYPLGVLFGLGFDTATEIGLLTISASQGAQGLSVGSTLIFPALFTAGMALVDTSDSVLMTRAYGWAFVNPLRKLWYNLTITAVSVLVALFVGGVEVLGLMADKLDLQGGVWQVVIGLNDDLADFGFVVVALLVGGWIISAAIYRWKGLDGLTADTP